MAVKIRWSLPEVSLLGTAVKQWLKPGFRVEKDAKGYSYRFTFVRHIVKPNCMFNLEY